MIVTQNGKVAVTPFPELKPVETGTAFLRNAQRTELVQLEVVFYCSCAGGKDNLQHLSDSDSDSYSEDSDWRILQPGDKVLVRGDARPHGKDIYEVDGKKFILLDEKLIVATVDGTADLTFNEPAKA